jgi:hypothetical protein
LTIINDRVALHQQLGYMRRLKHNQEGAKMAAKRKPPLIKADDLIALLARELDVHTMTVRRMIWNGQLPAPAIATSRRSRWWRRSDIEAWLDGKAA